MTTPTTAFYNTTGGNLAIDAPSYIERRADTDLYQALQQHEYCYILTSRQTGKSSLMVRVAERLRQAGNVVAALEITALGTNVTIEQWYFGLAQMVGEPLSLLDDINSYWSSHEDIGPLQRWMQMLRKVVLTHCSQPVVIFLDEIDVVRSLPFSTDEFFAGIRECFNARTQDPELQRLTFCLIGVATPSELIKDDRITPFNIGRRIDLTDFTEKEAAGLLPGLQRDEKCGRALLQRIFYWTNGHPYLTQKLCESVAKDKTVTRPAGVDRVCEELFFGSRLEEENLQHVRTMMLPKDRDHAAILDLYRQVRQRQEWRWQGLGKRIKDDDTNPLINTLRLAGVVRVWENYLWVRNRIYFRVFDKAWVLANRPDAEKQRQEKARRRGFWQATGIATVVIGIMAGLAVWAWFSQQRAVANLAEWAWLAQQRAMENEWLAEQQRNIAEQQKSLALQVVNTLTYDLIDQLLAIPRTKQIVLSIFETNVRTMEAIANLNPDTPKAQWENAVNSGKIGDVWMMLGDTQKALAAYQQMNDILKRRAVANPTNTQAQCDLATNYERQGDIQLRLGNIQVALDAYQEVIKISKPLVENNPKYMQASRELSIGYNKIGNVQLRLGQTTDALAAYQQSLDIRQRLAAADPTNTQAQRDVSVSYNNIGDVQLRLGQTTDALAAYQQSLDIRQRLAAADPTNTQAQRDVSISYEKIGDVQLRLGQTTDALATYQQSLEISKRLAAADPTNTQAQRDVSVSYNKIGDVQLRLGQTTDALATYQQSLEIRKRLAAADPTNTQAQRDVSVSYNNIGDVQLRLGQTTDALAAYQQSLDIRKRLAAADPTNTEAQRDVSVSYSRIAEVHLTQNELPAALAGYQQALAIDEKLLTQDPRNQTLQEDLASDQSKIEEIKGRLKK